ncbi:RNase H-like domain found in reverse transcriptase [Popillia japonica]|uniref:RNase H-like domain found in reverse transcriptase n=1 Tax=Popillia japonica TaxID=7064 RepID=A0AAW1N6J8_POPJA
MSKITSPLRNLTRQDVEFIWTTEHDNALKQVKHLLTNAPILSFFNPTEQIEIETDASKDGLGACLLQNGYPINDNASGGFT